MTDDDGSEILAGNVDDVKDSIDETEGLDYSSLLEEEKNGKDRKTVKEFLQKKIDEEDNAENEDNEQESMDEEEVENVPEPSSSDDSGFDSAIPLAAAGVVIGLLIGLAAGQMFMGTSGNPQQASQNVEDVIASGGFNGTVDVGTPDERHGMYYYNVSVTQETPNGSRTSYQPAYVTKDGELLFPEVQSFMLTSPINMPEAIAQNNQQQEAPAP